MSNTEYFLILSLIANFMMTYVVLIALSLYLHARQWRDEWRDAHVDMLTQMRDAVAGDATERSQDRASGARNAAVARLDPSPRYPDTLDSAQGKSVRHTQEQTWAQPPSQDLGDV